VPPRYQVRLTLGAEMDLESLYRHAVEHRSLAQAEDLLDTLSAAIGTLEAHPHRGAAPMELAALGIRDYRQLVVSPYRVIYRVIDAAVYVFVIADGRRDIQALLERRLLNPPTP
jgi:toxin ParE1/3/4